MTEESYTYDADVSHLETRIDELEATIRKMLPSRREALGMGVAGLAGASLMSGTASAGSAQVGTIGDNSNLVDLVAEDVTITDTLNTASLSGAAAGEALLSDGSGNLTFGSGGGGILRNGSDIDYVALDVVNLPASTGSNDVALVTLSDRYVQDNSIVGTRNDIGSSEFSQNTTKSGVGGVSDITFNDTGTKLYQVDTSNDRFAQFSLLTPFEVSTAREDVFLNAEDGFPQGIRFSNDGTKMFEGGFSGSKIYEYSLETPFEISTASRTLNEFSAQSDLRGFTFNDDGTKLYDISNTGLNIQQYTLSTPFDITTASFDTSISTQDSTPFGIGINNDGSKIYECGKTGQKIYQYNLSTPNDLSTASFELSINANGDTPTGVVFDNIGSRFFESNSGSDQFTQYTVTTGGWETL